MSHPVLAPGRIGPVALRNRVIKTATFEGLSPGGHVSDALIALHAGMATRGVALTTVAYGAVEDAGRTFPDQLLVDRTRRDGLARLADAVHAAGGAVSLQLAHGGGFSKHASRPAGPSAGWNAYGTASGRPWIRPMTADDLARTTDAFGEATRTAVDAGFDAVELHVGHGYLLSQFLSPIFNRRRDAYGGDLTGRSRFPVEVARRVVEAAGGRVGVLAKINVADGVPGGLEPGDAATVARSLEAAGVHAVIPSGGLVQRSAFFLLRGEVPLAEMAAAEPGWVQSVAMRVFGSFLVKPWPWSPGFFLEPGLAVVGAVGIPVVAVGGLDDAETLGRALDRGYAFVALGRSLLADPDLVERLAAGEAFASRCTHCNRCVAGMAGGVRCVLPDRPISA